MPASKASTNFPSVTNDPYTASDVNIIWSMSLLEPFTLFVNIASEPYKIISSREQVLYSIKHRDWIYRSSEPEMNYLHWSLYVIINTLLCSIYLTSFYQTPIRLFKYVFSVSHPWPTYTKEQLRLAFREFGKKPRLPSVMPASQWYICSFPLSTWWFMQIFINLYMKWILNFEDKNELVLNWNMHTPIHRKKKKKQ